MRKLIISLVVLIINVPVLFADNDSEVIAVVNLFNTYSITVGQFRAEVERDNMGKTNEPIIYDERERRRILDAMINERLILQAAERDKITISDNELNQSINQLKGQLVQVRGRQPTDAEFSQAIKSQTNMELSEFRENLRRQLIMKKYISFKRAATIRELVDELRKGNSFTINESNFKLTEQFSFLFFYDPENDFKAEKSRDGKSAVITGYAGSKQTVRIPETIQGLPVTSIGEGAFSGCTSLTSVTIPIHVTSIGDNAFSNCTSLTSAGMLYGVTTIGKAAFAYSGLTSIFILNKVTSIGDGAFYYCTNLNSAAISNKVTSIEKNTFSGCTSLTSITIPNSVTSIGEMAFAGCTSLTRVTFQGTIDSTNFNNTAFGSSGDQYYIGNLRAKYLSDGIGTYIRPNGTSTTWMKQAGD